MEIQPNAEDFGEPEFLFSQNQLNTRIQSGAQWFYGIGILFLGTAFYYLAKKSADYIAVVGLAELVYILLNGRGNPSEINLATIRTLSFCTAVLLGAFFLITGALAGKQNRRWFVLGIIIFVIDAAINFLVFDLPGIAIHLLGLWGLFSGLNAIDNLKKLRSGDATILRMYGNKSEIDKRAKIKYSTAVRAAIIIGVATVFPFICLYIFLKILVH